MRRGRHPNTLLRLMIFLLHGPITLFRHVRVLRGRNSRGRQKVAIVPILSRRPMVPVNLRFRIEGIEHVPTIRHRRMLAGRRRAMPIMAVAVHTAGLRPIHRPVRRCRERRRRLLTIGTMTWTLQRCILLPVWFTQENRVRRWTNLVKIHFHYPFGKFGNQRMTTVHVLAFPAPAESRKHVECKPDVFESGVSGQSIRLRHVPVKDNHCCDMQRNRGCEERDVRESDELTVDDDCVVRCDDC